MGKVKDWFEDKKIAYEQHKGRTREWIRNNPKEFTILCMVGISSVAGVAKVGLQYKMRMAQMKPKTMWDPTMGYHQELKKPLTPELKQRLNYLESIGLNRHQALRALDLI